MRRSPVRVTIVFGAAVLSVAVAASGAEARLDIYVDKSVQVMEVVENGTLLYVFPVSTARDRSSMPSGVYAPERLERSWFSKAYYNVPMPYAILLRNGYAIHGSSDISKVGGPASRGCIRLYPRDAAALFSMVEQEGPGNTAIVIGGDRDPPPEYRGYEEPGRPFREGDPRQGDPRQGDPRQGDPRQGEAAAHSAYPRDPRLDPRLDPRAPPADRYADSRGAYPPPPGRGLPPPDYDPDRRYGAERGTAEPYPRGRPDAPYDESGGYADRRQNAPPGPPRAVPDYGAGPYADGRRGLSDARGRPPDGRLQDGRSSDNRPDPHYPAEGVPGRPMTPPFYADRSVDAPGRPRGDASPPSARVRSPAPAAKARSSHGADEPPGRGVAPPPAAILPPVPPGGTPALRQPPPPEQAANAGVAEYQVLPRSYWSGAAWRWGIRREERGGSPGSP